MKFIPFLLFVAFLVYGDLQPALYKDLRSPYENLKALSKNRQFIAKVTKKEEPNAPKNTLPKFNLAVYQIIDKDELLVWFSPFIHDDYADGLLVSDDGKTVIKISFWNNEKGVLFFYHYGGLIKSYKEEDLSFDKSKVYGTASQNNWVMYTSFIPKSNLFKLITVDEKKLIFELEKGTLIQTSHPLVSSDGVMNREFKNVSILLADSCKTLRQDESLTDFKNRIPKLLICEDGKIIYPADSIVMEDKIDPKSTDIISKQLKDFGFFEINPSDLFRVENSLSKKAGTTLFHARINNNEHTVEARYKELVKELPSHKLTKILQDCYELLSKVKPSAPKVFESDIIDVYVCARRKTPLAVPWKIETILLPEIAKKKVKRIYDEELKEQIIQTVKNNKGVFIYEKKCYDVIAQPVIEIE